MNRKLSNLFYTLLLMIPAIVSCSHTSGIYVSDSQKKAEVLNIRGLRAAEKNELQDAERLFLSAIIISTSIEDYSAKAKTYINLARLYRLNKSLIKAEAYISKAAAIKIDDSSIYSECYYEKALLELATNRPNEALLSASNSLHSEGEFYKGKRRNLVSRCLYLSGKKNEALMQAMVALSENASSELHEEEANSYYMVGIINRDNKLLNESINFFLKALKIDKKLGISNKIIRDLEGLALTSEAQGANVAAVSYWQRAKEIYVVNGKKAEAEKIDIKIGNDSAH